LLQQVSVHRVLICVLRRLLLGNGKGALIYPLVYGVSVPGVGQRRL
jgi:hypothetical protein